jgi:hypothetical protein
MKTTALVTVDGAGYAGYGKCCFRLHVSGNGAPEDMAALLLPPLPRVRKYNWDAGAIMANVVGLCHRAEVPCRLLGNDLTASDWYYRLTPDIYCGSVTVSVSDAKKELFRGTPQNFAAWAANRTELGHLEKKAVTFYYDGGTVPGKRLVRVEKVGRDDKGEFIEGYDLGKDNLQQAYRRYLKAKVVGDITVLN